MLDTTKTHIERTISAILAELVGMDIQPTAQQDWRHLSEELNIVSSLPLAGSVLGNASVFYSLPLAISMTCRLLSITSPVSTAEILDATAEIANIIVGNIKGLLEVQFGSIRMGVPVVRFRSDQAPQAFPDVGSSESGLNLVIALAASKQVLN